MRKYLFFLFLFFLLFSCKNKKNIEINLVIGYIPHVQFTPLYVGINNKIFENYGINLKINYGFGLDTFTMLESRNADIALSDSDQLLIANSKGLKLYPVFQYYNRYPVSLVTIDKNINSISDFKNKKIGVPELAGTSYIGLLKLLELNKLTKNDLQIERIGYTQIESLELKKVDGVVCFYNNEPIKLRKKYSNLKEWALKDYVELAGASFIISKNQLDTKKDLIEKFIRALKESIKWTIENRKEALNISYSIIGNLQEEDREYWSEVLDNTLELIVTGAGSYNPKSNNLNESTYKNAGKIDYELYIKTYEELKKLNLIEKDYDVKEFLVF